MGLPTATLRMTPVGGVVMDCLYELRVLCAWLLIAAVAVSAMCPVSFASQSAELSVVEFTGPERVAPGETMSGRIVLSRVVAEPCPITVRWADPLGRIGGRTEVVVPRGQDRVTYSLVLRDPVSRRGWIEAVSPELSRPARLKFKVVFPPRPWDDYYAFVWARYPRGFYNLLRQYGVNGTMIYRESRGETAKEADFAFYIDQMCWEVFSYYHKARWAWRAAKQAYAENPRYTLVRHRVPCLHEESTYVRLEQNYGSMIKIHRDDRPMFYNLADEIGLGDQSGPMDFCWEYSARDQWIEFLKRIYPTLDDLNAQWGTDYPTWSRVRAVQPTTYREYARLWRMVYLPREFSSPDSDAVLERFGSRFSSFDGMVDLYMALVTSNPVDERYIRKWLTGSTDESVPAGAAGEDVTARQTVPPAIASLNAKYGCNFRTFADVARFYNEFDKWTFSLQVDVTSPDASQMKGWNLSPWCDFREFMDETVAKAMKRAVEICRKYDPDGRYGFTGTHHSGVFSGQNYAKLCKVVDIIVPYNIGNTPEIIRSLYPDRCIQIGPSWFSGNEGIRDIWTQLLHGDRGIIFWDNDEPKHRFFLQDTRQPTERAKSLGPTLRKIESGIAKLLYACRRENHGIAIYYSQPSIRVAWWRQYLPMGRRWIELESWHLYRDSWRNVLRSSWCRLIEDCNLQYDFVSHEQVLYENRLADGRYKVLILPEVFALSDAEAERIRKFVAAGGIVIADNSPGVMDEHGKWRDRPVLADIWDNSRCFLLGRSMLMYSRLRMNPGSERELRKPVERILFEVAGIRPTMRIVGSDGQPLTAAEVHTFHAGPGVRIVGVDRSIQRRPEGPDGRKYADNSPFEKVERVTVVLDRPQHIYDVMTGRYLGQHREVQVDLDPWVPLLWTLSDAPLPPIKAGEVALRDGAAELALTAEPPNVIRVARVDVFDPPGRPARHYSANVLIADGRAVHRIPFALNDPTGQWKIVVRDVMTGQTLNLALQR